MRPNLGKQLEINRIDSLGILIQQTVNGQIVGRCCHGVGSGLAAGTGWQEKGDSGNENSDAHRSPLILFRDTSG
jgi:hypothetical protein